jgi:hypothetical protein
MTLQKATRIVRHKRRHKCRRTIGPNNLKFWRPCLLGRMREWFGREVSRSFWRRFHQIHNGTSKNTVIFISFSVGALSLTLCFYQDWMFNGYNFLNSLGNWWRYCTTYIYIHIYIYIYIYRCPTRFNNAQYIFFISLLNYSTCFGCILHPSSEVQETVVVDHWYKSYVETGWKVQLVIH